MILRNLRIKSIGITDMFMRIMIIFSGLLYPVLLLAQLSGRVVDAQTLLPLENARVTTSEGEIRFTDASGYFEMDKHPAYEKILVSCLGYLQQEVQIGEEKNLVITLQPDPEHIEAVTISASAFSGRIRNQTGSMNLMLASNARFRNQEHISGWLNQVPGIYMHHGGYNTNRLTVRGIGSREPYGNTRIKAYLNDIPITGGDGVTVIEDLSLSGIQRIEILRGPSSAIYGAGLAGVLRIFTPYPGEKGFGIHSLHEAGSFGMHKHALNMHYKEGPGVLSIDLGRQQSGGFRENSNYFNNHLLFDGDLFLKHLRIGLVFRVTDMKGRIPSSLNDSVFRTDPSAAASNWLAIGGYEQYTGYLAGLSLSGELNRGLSHQSTFFAGRKAVYESRPFNILEDQNTNYGFRSRVQFERPSFRGIAGMELFAENIGWSTFETFGGEKGALQDDILENRYYTNLFNLYRWSQVEGLILEAGWNLGWVSFNLVESNIQAYPREKHRFPLVFSPRVGGNYRISDRISLFGSASHGFSTPSFQETLLPEGIRNNGLKPEKGWNFELGARGDLWDGRLKYDLSSYMIRVKNLLVTKRLSEEIFTGINAGSSLHRGVESRIRLYILDHPGSLYQLAFVHSFQHSVNRFLQFTSDSIDNSGNHLPGIPSFKSHFKLDSEFPWNLGSELSWLQVGRQYMTDGNEKSYGGYGTVDWNLSWSPAFSEKAGISLTFGVNNILDSSYASMILINAPSFGNVPPRYYYPGMPRNVYLQLRINLN